ncbi:MAG: hypothetical protein HKP55_06530 [Gammaproteobacteria bacterium]|nr:hypothetical protein [Gammaproteobacteria bacterium]
MKDIHWPAILHYENDPELEYLENEAALIQTLVSTENTFEQNDSLIDSQGQVFSCQQLAQASLENTEPKQQLTLETVLGLIKAHLADCGSCCVAKTYAPTIRDAIMMLKNKECGIE